MEPLSGSAGRPADHWPERIAPESDQDCRMDASNRKAFPVESSAAQPVHDVPDADGETITGDGSHKGEERQKEAAKPKAPPPAAMNCAECGQRCGLANGAVHWSDEEDPTVRVATCGPICLMSHYSNALWLAENGDCEDQQTRRWTPDRTQEQLRRFMNGTHFRLADVGSARTVADHSGKTSAEQPAHECDSTVTFTTANQQRRYGYSHDEVKLVAGETHPPTPPTPRSHEHGVSGCNYEQATLLHSPHANSASSASGQSCAERPANDWQVQVDPAGLGELLEQRYQTPGRPKSV